jgi:hypothetical protein
MSAIFLKIALSTLYHPKGKKIYDIVWYSSSNDFTLACIEWHRKDMFI